MNALRQVSWSTFSRDVLQSPVPVLVDFSAKWCGPCRLLAPTLEKLSREFAGRVEIVQVDVDAEPGLAAQFHVQSIPTLAWFAGGRLLGQSAGLASEPSLRQALQQLASRQVSSPTRRVG